MGTIVYDISDTDDQRGIAAASGKSFVGRKETTATRWLAEHGVTAPPGIATEMPPWMLDAINEQLKQSFAGDWWDGVNDTTLGDVQEVIAAGLEEGLSIREMADQIEGTLNDEYYDHRSENIARTESGNALNGAAKASIDALQDELGDQVPMRATWGSVLSVTTREAHAELDGVPADDDGMWDLNGVLVPWPGHWLLPVGDRANCQCFVTAELGMQDDEANQLIADYNARVAAGEEGDEEEPPVEGKSWVQKKLSMRGGPGSGNFGHEGRPGEVGGSGGGLAAARLASIQELMSKPKDREYQIILNHNTGEVLHKSTGTSVDSIWETGEPASVVVPPALLTGNTPLIQLHTHPIESGPSDGDWAAMGHRSIVEMNVVSPRFLYTLKRNDIDGVAKPSQRDLRERWNAILAEEENKTDPGESLTSYAIDLIDSTNDRMGLEFASRGFSYSKTPLPSAKSTKLHDPAARRQKGKD